MKTMCSKEHMIYLERERSIHEKLNHPLIVGFEKCIPTTQLQPAAILMEFVPNGTLVDHLPELNNFSHGTRNAIIVTGIVLAMRYLHFRSIVHRDLKPANVFIDWNWIVRIGDFNHSLLTDAFGLVSEKEMSILTSTYPYDCRYIAPECFYNSPNLKSDVFSFGLILYELFTGNPPFPPDLPGLSVCKKLVLDGFRPDIPGWIAPNVKKIILDCLKQDPDERPSFTENL
jgi:serine/threonine protein kinase